MKKVDKDVQEWLREQDRSNSGAYTPGYWGDNPSYSDYSEIHGEAPATYHRPKRPPLSGRSI